MKAHYAKDCIKSVLEYTFPDGATISAKFVNDKYSQDQMTITIGASTKDGVVSWPKKLDDIVLKAQSVRANYELLRNVRTVRYSISLHNC